MRSHKSAQSSMASNEAHEKDYRSRFKVYQELEDRKDGLIEELLGYLDRVKGDHDEVVSVLRADLENERDGRRRLQREISALREMQTLTEQARFVLVLIDADADIYLFHERYLKCGLQGGQAAADDLMLKVREYLDPVVKDAKNVPIMVKAYANLTGLAQACVRERKLNGFMDLSTFFVGFTRRYPLVDFVDVGPGKEEADAKIREVLNFYVGNKQCEHILLACCHDMGYIPVLRQYAAHPSSAERITLAAGESIYPGMANLGLRTTTQFASLFSPNGLPPRAPASLLAINKAITISLLSDENLVSNVNRLRPVLKNDAGRRIDKELSVDEGLAQALKKRNLCNWHYLRADCKSAGTTCKHGHGYARPLNRREYDALWFLSRQAPCYRNRKGGVCEDDKCIYGHCVS